MHQIKRTKKEQRWCVTIKTYCKILFVLNAVSGVYLCVSVRVWLTYKTFAAYKLNQMLDIEWPITTRLYYYCFFFVVSVLEKRVHSSQPRVLYVQLSRAQETAPNWNSSKFNYWHLQNNWNLNLKKEASRWWRGELCESKSQ